MLLLGHMGLTLPVARVIDRFVSHMGRGKNYGLIDYRLVLLGSMLPDIIDKPLGGIILRETLGNGRVYAHTLAFLLLLCSSGWLLWRCCQGPGLLVLAGGSVVHDLLDGMWSHPAIFLWPLYGWGFPRGFPEDWFRQWLVGLLYDPHVFVPELMGGIILLFFLRGMVGRKVATGKFDGPEGNRRKGI